MEREEVRTLVNQYCHLRDVQYGAYTAYARRHGLTTHELFVLDIVWFAPDGVTQGALCRRMSASRQSVSATVGKFVKRGWFAQTAADGDRRARVIRLTEEGRRAVGAIIPPAAEAEVSAMGELTGEEIETLVRLTARFSEAMERRFRRAAEESKKEE